MSKKRKDLDGYLFRHSKLQQESFNSFRSCLDGYSGINQKIYSSHGRKNLTTIKDKEMILKQKTDQMYEPIHM